MPYEKRILHDEQHSGESVVTLPGAQKVCLFFAISRKPEHAVRTILMPTYALSLVVCLSYMLNATSGERVGLIIAVQLAIVFIITLVEANAAPPGDYNPPIILGFIMFVTVHCIIAFVETIAIIYFYSDGLILNPNCIKNFTK